MSHNPVNISSKLVDPDGSTDFPSGSFPIKTYCKVRSAAASKFARAHTCEGRPNPVRSPYPYATSYGRGHRPYRRVWSQANHILMNFYSVTGVELIQPDLRRSHRSSVTAQEPYHNLVNQLSRLDATGFRHLAEAHSPVYRSDRVWHQTKHPRKHATQRSPEGQAMIQRPPLLPRPYTSSAAVATLRVRRNTFHDWLINVECCRHTGDLQFTTQRDRCRLRRTAFCGSTHFPTGVRVPEHVTLRVLIVSAMRSPCIVPSKE